MNRHDQAGHNQGQKVYIIFPCYNEEEGLEKLLMRVKNVEKVSGRDFRLVIVNDGSRDHTVSVAKAYEGILNIHLIDFKKNQGVDVVFNTAMEYVLSQAGENDIVITIDSDNTTNPYTILDMLPKFPAADVVIASRFIPGGRMVGAGYRTVLSHIASRLMRWRAGLPGVTDYSIFLRAYKLKTIREVFQAYNKKPVEGQGFSCMANLLLRIRQVNPGTVFAEVPLVLRYDMKEGGSAVKLVRTTFGYLELAFGKKR